MSDASAEAPLAGRTVLVTGAGGFIGGHLCDHLEARGATVRRASRTAEGGAVAVGSIDGLTDWGEALAGVELVVHLAARVHVLRERAADPMAEFRRVNVDGTRRLARSAVAAGVRRLVLLSSVGVHGQVACGVLDERSPTRPETPYAASKLEAERALAEVAAGGELETVIVRPPLVYGPGDPGNLPRLIRWVRSGLPLPLGAARGPRSYIFVGNLVDLLARCLVHPAAAGEVFLAADGRDLSTAELVRELAAALGRRVLLVPVPRAVLAAGARLLGRSRDVDRLFGTLRIDPGRARRRLAWRPPFTVEQGLEAALRPPAA